MSGPKLFTGGHPNVSIYSIFSRISQLQQRRMPQFSALANVEAMCTWLQTFLERWGLRDGRGNHGFWHFRVPILTSCPLFSLREIAPTHFYASCPKIQILKCSVSLEKSPVFNKCLEGILDLPLLQTLFNLLVLASSFIPTFRYLVPQFPEVFHVVLQQELTGFVLAYPSANSSFQIFLLFLDFYVSIYKGGKCSVFQKYCLINFVSSHIIFVLMGLKIFSPPSGISRGINRCSVCQV